MKLSWRETKLNLLSFPLVAGSYFFLPKTERMTEIMATNTVLTKSQLFLVHESQPLVNELQLRKKIEKSIELICFTTSFLHR